MNIKSVLIVLSVGISLWVLTPVAEAVRSRDARFNVVMVAKDLKKPWAVDFLPDTSPLITLKEGALIMLRNGRAVPIAGIPEIQSTGQGGLLDLLVPGDFDKTGLIYLAFSSGPSGRQQTSVARARLMNWEGPDIRVESWQVIFKGTNTAEGGHHFGSRLTLTPGGYLYITLGERNQRYEAQNADNHFGTVVRIFPDGRIPEDNPFQPGQTMAGQGAGEVFTYGHRNAQGMAMHPETGDIWIHEHGPKGGDEINILKPGVNYGWPVITHGKEYSGAAVGKGITEKDGMAQPLLHWTPSIAPSGMAFYTGNIFPGWQGDLFVGALAGRHLRRVYLGGEQGDQVVYQEVLLKKHLGRIRDVAQGPDGFLYILTDGKKAGLYRLEPDL
jgi:aldose sugar dehydrogenase